MNARLFALCPEVVWKNQWGMFSSDGKVDGTFVSNLLNLFNWPKGPLSAQVLLGGKERPHVAFLCFSSSGQLLLGGLCCWRV